MGVNVSSSLMQLCLITECTPTASMPETINGKKIHKSNWARCLAKWQHIVFGEVCAGKVFHCPPETLDIICFWLIIAAVVGRWNHPLLAISSKQRQDKPGLKKDQCLFACKGPRALHHLQSVGVYFQTNTAGGLNLKQGTFFLQ